MKVAVFTDVHANLPALRAALDALEREGCDLLVHLGDSVAIGPFPAETLDLLLSTPNTRFVMGNHDECFAHGLPDPLPQWMSQGEIEHQGWTHRQLDPALRKVVAEWPYHLRLEFDGTPTIFVHYPLDASGRKFARFMRNPTSSDLDDAFALFAPDTARLAFYGHNHHFSDLQGRARYVNPGSLGCAPHPIARFSIVEYRQGTYRLEHHSVPYDDMELIRAFEQRAVPDRAFIYRAFLGARFQGNK